MKSENEKRNHTEIARYRRLNELWLMEDPSEIIAHQQLAAALSRFLIALFEPLCTARLQEFWWLEDEYLTANTGRKENRKGCNLRLTECEKE